MDTENNEVSEETIGETSEESFDVTEKSLEELDALLASDSGEETEETQEEQEDESSKEQQAAAETEAPETQDDSQEEQSEDETVESLKAKVARQKQQLEQQELFIQRRNTELGSLRKERTELIAQLEEGLEDKFLESPREAAKDQRAIERAEEELEAIDEETELLNRVHQTQTIVAAHVSEGDLDVSGMAQILAEDGASPEFVKHFETNPHAITSPEVIISYAKRVKERRMMGQLVAIARKLKAENEQLQKKPGSVLNKIEKAARQSTSINTSSGQSESSSVSLEVDPAQMSDDQIEELLKAAD